MIFEFDETIQKVNDAFGDYENKTVEHPVFAAEEPITETKVNEVFGPTSESVYVSYRTDKKVRSSRNTSLWWI